MTTTLEKMTAVIEAKVRAAQPIHGWDATEIARAALEAIREPTIPVAAAGQWHWLAKIMGFSTSNPPVIDCVEANQKARENFTVMIDAILNEKTP
jgi:hypothetical protein